MSDYHFLGNKVVDYAEIVVCLFDHCNLKCVFCPQNHQSDLGASRDEILEKVSPISHWINSNQKSKYFKLHIMGGELFQDYWIEQGHLKIYQQFIDKIRASVDPQKDIVPNFITNLVFSKKHEVLAFLKHNNLKISISYDPKGRFSSEQLKTFQGNVEYFKDHIEMVSVVMTKQNIAAITKGHDYFDYLYQNFVIDFDQFLPAVDVSNSLIPKESEKLQFMKFLVNCYPKCLNVEHFVQNDYYKKMICTRGNSFTILSDGTIPPGCSGSIFLKDGDASYLGKEDIVENYLDDNNCYQCEYYSRCPFTCFVSDHYKDKIKDISTCIYKEIFDYAQT